MTTATTEKIGAEEILWDLSDLYSGPDDPQIQADIAEALEAAKVYRKKYYGKIASLDAKGLLEAVTEQERITSLVAKALIYAQLRFTTDTSDPARGALFQKLQEQATALSTELVFFNLSSDSSKAGGPAPLEWVAVDEDSAARILADPTIDKYRHLLESFRRYKPHVLSENEEKILTEKALTGVSAWDRLFDEQTAAIRVKFEDKEITWEAASSKLYSPDPDLRRTIAKAMTEALQPGVRTRSFIFNTILLDKATDDRLRAYPTWLSSRNLANEASDESVEALVQAVIQRFDISHRYYGLKAKILGVEKIKDYDRYAAISQDSAKMSWDEARDTVVGAYASFSPRAGDAIRTFFDNEWIDAVASENKVPGAFCHTNVPNAHPYVLMSYTGERRSVLVLAHELGHGLHGYLARDLGYLNARTPLTLSETASVFGESLTFGRLLDAEEDPKRRLALLAARLEDLIATVFRQTSMNRFEDAVHTARREQGELSPEMFSEFWYETQSAVLGPYVEITDDYKTWWSYIPHFIGTPGYVYAYAFGCLFSLAIYNKYLEEGESMVEPYLTLLAAGGSDSPERLAKIVGLDLTDPNFWAGGLNAIDRILAEAEALA